MEKTFTGGSQTTKFMKSSHYTVQHQKLGLLGMRYSSMMLVQLLLQKSGTHINKACIDVVISSAVIGRVQQHSSLLYNRLLHRYIVNSISPSSNTIVLISQHHFYSLHMAKHPCIYFCRCFQEVVQHWCLHPAAYRYCSDHSGPLASSL